MLTRLLIPISFVMLAGCGGGGSSNTSVQEDAKPEPRFQYQKIRVSGFRGDELTGLNQNPAGYLGTDFGQIIPGNAVTRRVIINNLGKQTLRLQSFPVIEGVGFSIEGASNLEIPPLGKNTYLVHFTPQGVSSVDGKLVISSNSPGQEIITQPLHGEGIAQSNNNLYKITVKQSGQALALDANSDGHLDIITWDLADVGKRISNIHIHINDGHGKFQEQTDTIARFPQNTGDGVPTTYRYIDLLGEGTVGILTGHMGFEPSGPFVGPEGGKLHYYYPDKNGNLQDRTDLFPGYWSETEDFDVADIDGDGRNEIFLTQVPGGVAVTEPGILKYVNGAYHKTQAGMTREMTSPTGLFFSINFIDLYGNGNSDILLGFRHLYTALNGKTTDTLAINDGWGQFSLATSSPMPDSRSTNGQDCHRAIVTDVNGDGQPDVIQLLRKSILSSPGAGDVVKVYLNNHGTFIEGSNGLPLAYDATRSGINHIRAIDANHDGRIDLLVESTQGGQVWQQQIDGSFKLARVFPSVTNSDKGTLRQIIPGDFDDDGYLDYVLIYNFVG
ncbi:FG-GAP-like repeat-containing protein [Sphaerotilus montanus]|uniref:FG-GAP-like repeat-containing protein n=1 Tax=Sphaerotilus montanus TaxID=522889 RepID=UPI003FA25C20